MKNESEIITFILNEVRRLTNEEVSMSSSLVRSGLVSSLIFLDLIVAIEERYNIFFSSQEMTPDSFDTAEQLATLISLKLDAV